MKKDSSKDSSEDFSKDSSEDSSHRIKSYSKSLSDSDSDEPTTTTATPLLAKAQLFMNSIILTLGAYAQVPLQPSIDFYVRIVPLLSPTDTYTADQQLAIGNIVAEFGAFLATIFMSLPGIALAYSNDTIGYRFGADPASLVYFNALNNLSDLLTRFEQNATGLYALMNDPTAYMSLGYADFVIIMNTSQLIMAY